MEQGLRLITEDKDVVYMCEIHAAWLTDRIKLYVEGVEEPFVVEELGQNAEVNEGVVGQNDDDVHEVREVVVVLLWGSIPESLVSQGHQSFKRLVERARR